jgi:hypothetical protein
VGVDEKTLRSTRNELLEGVAELHRGQGQIPNTRGIEAFVDPIINKVDKASGERLAPAPKLKNRRVNQGEWYGEADHSPMVGRGGIAPAQAGETVRLESKWLGEYAVVGDKVKPLNGAPDGKRQMSAGESFTRWVVGQLMHHPDFKRRLQQVTFSDLQGDAREKAFRRILADAYRLFGDARAVWAGKPADAKIIVGGK